MMVQIGQQRRARAHDRAGGDLPGRHLHAQLPEERGGGQPRGTPGKSMSMSHHGANHNDDEAEPAGDAPLISE
jgi:hypothetical protein